MGVPAEPHTWFILTTSWADISDDELVLGAAAKLVNTIVELSKQQGKHHRFLYLNDAAGDQKVIESYGEEQVEFLKGVSARVDPTGVFQTLVKGGFKLPE